MKILKIKKMNEKYIYELIKNNPELCSGRKNYNVFEKRIIKNILLIKLMAKKKNLNKFRKSKPSFIINKKVAKVTYK